MRMAVATRSYRSEMELALKGEHFAQLLQSIEFLHRRFLDVITVEFGRRSKTLSSVQALLLSHVGEKPMSLGELQALGHYEGTNLAYNIGKLAENGYITLIRPQWDKRSSIIELTAEGRDVAQLMSQLLDSHAAALAETGISQADLSLTTRMLKGLNRAWSI